jgi:4-hydroxy-tetrahydrodipicolinate synthase
MKYAPMPQTETSSRRAFVGKMAAAVLGTAIAGNAHSQLPAKHEHAGSDFTSDKKFVPVMITPYKQNGQIDFDGLSRLMDFYAAAGVKGYFANCNSSEMYNLTEAERLALAKHVVKRANGAVSVVATGSFGETLNDKAEFAKKMYHTGINAVILITSHFAKAEESDDTLIKNLETFLDLTDNIPMGTYECPAPYKRILTPYAFKYLLGTNRLIYHKDTTIDFDKVKVKIELAKNTRLEFYDACIANTMYSLQAGAKGISPICGNFYPEIVAWMCENSTNPNKQDDVKFIQAEIARTEDLIGQNYPLSAKYFLKKRGVPIEISSRVNPDPLTTAQKQVLDGVYTRFTTWCDRIGMKPATI